MKELLFEKHKVNPDIDRYGRLNEKCLLQNITNNIINQLAGDFVGAELDKEFLKIELNKMIKTESLFPNKKINWDII